MVKRTGGCDGICVWKRDGSHGCLRASRRGRPWRQGSGGGERWWGGGKSDVTEDTGHGEGIGEEGEDPHLGAAVGTESL